MHFGSNGMHPKFTVLAHFRTQFTAGKAKILLKTKISAKTTSLRTSNVSPRFQKSLRILVKLSKKKFFWGSKSGLNCPPPMGPRQRVIRNSHMAYNRTIYLYFPDTNFQLLDICRSRVYPEETTTFLVQDPIGPILGGLVQ